MESYAEAALGMAVHKCLGALRIVVSGQRGSRTGVALIGGYLELRTGKSRKDGAVHAVLATARRAAA
jgi:hypothetical protein